jgi:hypothetical protein
VFVSKNLILHYKKYRHANRPSLQLIGSAQVSHRHSLIVVCRPEQSYWAGTRECVLGQETYLEHLLYSGPAASGIYGGELSGAALSTQPHSAVHSHALLYHPAEALTPIVVSDNGPCSSFEFWLHCTRAGSPSLEPAFAEGAAVVEVQVTVHWRDSRKLENRKMENRKMENRKMENRKMENRKNTDREQKEYR